MGIGATVGATGRGFRGSKRAKMATQMAVNMSRTFVDSKPVPVLSAKAHCVLSSTVHLYHSKWNQASLFLVGRTSVRQTVRRGSLLLFRFAERQNRIRAQPYNYTTDKNVKSKLQMSVSSGSTHTLGAIIRFKFPLTAEKGLLLSSAFSCTMVRCHLQMFRELSSSPNSVEKQHVATVTSATKIVATAGSDIIQTSLKILDGNTLPSSSQTVVDQTLSLVEKSRKVLKARKRQRESVDGNGIISKKYSNDSMPVSASNVESLAGEINHISNEGGLIDDNMNSFACTASEFKAEATIIAFDIETTGLRLADDRIIEFAARDLAGGDCSTLQTLVNPGRKVPSSGTLIHGIRDEMVNRSDIPSWSEVAAAILQFVELRRKGGPVIFVAHNGKRFDVPFIIKAFHDCAMELPSWWYFVDSLPLAREAMKVNGLKRTTFRLSSLHEHYGLPSQGPAHRAMADVHMLASVFGMLMKDLQLPMSELLERAFKAEDVIPSIIKQGIPLPGLDFSEEKFQRQLQHLSSADEDDNACVNSQDDDDLAEINVTRLDDSGQNFLVPWEDSHVHNTNTSCLQLIESVSENVEVEGGFFVTRESSPSLSVISQLDRKLCPSVISSLNKIEDKPLTERMSMDSLKSQSDEMALTIPLERLDTDPVGRDERQLDISTLHEGTERGTDVLISVSESLVDINQNKAGPLIHDQIEGHDNFRTSENGGSSLVAADETDLHTSSVDISLLSSMMKQYVEVKRERPTFLLLSRVGDLYETFFEDAEVFAKACNLKIGAVDGGKLMERRVPMAGVPYYTIDSHLRMLLSKGISVVKQDQVTVEGRNGALSKRQVTAVLTPGTILDDRLLEATCNNYLVSVVPPCDDDDTWGLSYADISTGEFYATQCEGKHCLLQEILRVQPSEVLFPSNVSCKDSKDLALFQSSALPTCVSYSPRPLSDFSFTQKDLSDFLGGDPLENIGFSNCVAGISAAGALLRYVQEIQGVNFKDIALRKLCLYSVKDSLNFDDNLRSHLELMKTTRWGKSEGSLIWAMAHTVTAMGNRLLKRWILRPLLKHDEINQRHDAVELLANNEELRANVRMLIASIGDFERLISRTAWMRAEARDLFSLAEAIEELQKLSTILEVMPENKYFSAARTLPLSALISARKVQEFMVLKPTSRSQEGYLMKKGVDETLDLLRKQIVELESCMRNFEDQEKKRTGLSSLEVGYSKPLGRFLSIKRGELGDQSIPENYQRVQTLKDEECFVTSQLLELEKKRVDTILMACKREEEILVMLKQEMAEASRSLHHLSEAIAALDVLSSFAELATKGNYVRPEILASGRELTIVSGRHPVVELELAETRLFISNSTYLGYDPPKALRDGVLSEDHLESDAQSKPEDEMSWPRSDLILLTGPTSSGKSSYLRQVGLIQILAQAGSFVPAKRARMSITDAIFTQFGGVDDRSTGQHTFQVELAESADILKCATSTSLVLLDEVEWGAGSQGEAIARAIVEYLSQHLKARTVFSTNYYNLHHMGYQFPNISNYHFEVHETETGGLMFEHALKLGCALEPHSVHLGRIAGLPQWVCNRASELLSSKFDCSSVWDPDEPVDDLQGHVPKVVDPGEVASNSPKQPESMQKLGITDSNFDVVSSNTFTEAFNWKSWLRKKWKGVERPATVSIAKQSSGVDDHAAGSLKSADSGLEVSFSNEELKETWKEVLKVLQNRPATLALAKQKGSLLAISKLSDGFYVKLGAPELFVKKFEQHEHALAIEAAYETVLKQQIKLQVCTTISTVDE